MSLPPPVNLLSPYVSAYKVGVATGVCTKGVFPFKEQNSVLLIKGDFVKKNGARSHGLVMRFCIPRKRRRDNFVSNRVDQNVRNHLSHFQLYITVRNCVYILYTLCTERAQPL